MVPHSRLSHKGKIIKKENIHYYLAFVDQLQSKAFQEYPLVDLGTGGQIDTIEFAYQIGFNGFVGIDVDRQIDPQYSPPKEMEDFEILGIQMEMLHFLENLPDNSCNISLFGIDTFVMPINTDRNAIKKEIQRVVPKDGIIFVSSINILDLDDSFIYDSSFKRMC